MIIWPSQEFGERSSFVRYCAAWFQLKQRLAQMQLTEGLRTLSPESCCSERAKL